MADRRAFLTGASAAALTLAVGVPTAAPTIDFDPAAVFNELDAVGVDLWLCRPVGPDAQPPYYAIVPRRGGFTRAQLEVMARWADMLEAEPHRTGRLETHLAAFESEIGVR